MGNSPEEDAVKERIRISNLKHRGNILAISKETGYQYYFVKKIVDRLRRTRVDEPYNELVAKTLSDYIIEGHKQRVAYYEEMLRSLQMTEQFEVSDCCSAIFRIVEKDGVQTEVCRTCSTPAKKKTLNQLEVFKMEMDLLTELRNEAKALGDFSVRMGFTNAPAKAPLIKQDFLVISGGQQTAKTIEGSSSNKPIEIDAKEVYTVEQINNMPPAEREKLRSKLHKEIMLYARESQPSEEKEDKPS